MNESSRGRFSPILMALGLVGLLLGGLLVGYEPVGGDPDRLYRPLKEELHRFLAAGQLPFWSGRFGLGIPLVAESHVAAFYPLNWVFYTFCNISVAYRLAMWLHYLFLAGATYAYARFLKISAHGAALAAIAFTLCGFQAIHSSHEPFYHALPYLPLALLLGEWYMAEGRILALVLIACAWGTQLTLGHFQLQMWTASLVLLVGLWRAWFDGRPWQRLGLLMLGLLWGAAMASVQLAASWELARFVGSTERSFSELAFFGFPPAHWAELAIPGFARGIPGGPDATYWYALGTSGYEACFYVGTLPLILAFVGMFGGHNRLLAPWLLISAAALILAMLPTLWPAGYSVVLSVPAVGWFRAPGRYVLLSSLGLCLFAGRGLDRALEEAPIMWGLGLSLAFAAGAGAWLAYWASSGDRQPVLNGPRLMLCLTAAAICWAVALLLVMAWRQHRIGAWALLVATAAELGCLYYTSTTVWGWAIDLPEQSIVLAWLAAEPGVGHVAGLLHDLPVRAGAAPIFPYTGFAPPPPHRAIELATNHAAASTRVGLARLRRHGVTHGIWDESVVREGVVTLMETEDPTLDRLVFKPPGAPGRATWRIVRYPDPFPQVRAATRVRIATHKQSLLSGIDFDPDPQTVWYAAEDQPLNLAEPRAGSARVISWDGRTAVVQHDGNCDLVIDRTYYPGWMVSIDDDNETAVARAELGIQAVHLAGKGTSRVTVTYRPTYLAQASRIGLAAVAVAGLFLLVGLARVSKHGAP
jgi:hypothetical protein